MHSVKKLTDARTATSLRDKVCESRSTNSADSKVIVSYSPSYEKPRFTN